MNAFLFAVVAALCAQASVAQSSVTSPYNITGVYDDIASLVATTLNPVQDQIDVSSILSLTQAATDAGKVAITAFYTQTVAQKAPATQKSIAQLVKAVNAAQKPASCSTDYSSSVSFFTKYYSSMVINCQNLRLALPLQDSLDSLKTYIGAEATNMYGDLTTATAGGKKFIPAFVTAAGAQLSKTISATVQLGWARQAASFQICLAAVSDEATQASTYLINKITKCL